MDPELQEMKDRIVNRLRGLGANASLHELYGMFDDGGNVLLQRKVRLAIHQLCQESGAVEIEPNLYRLAEAPPPPEDDGTGNGWKRDLVAKRSVAQWVREHVALRHRPFSVSEIVEAAKSEDVQADVNTVTQALHREVKAGRLAHHDIDQYGLPGALAPKETEEKEEEMQTQKETNGKTSLTDWIRAYVTRFNERSVEDVAAAAVAAKVTDRTDSVGALMYQLAKRGEFVRVSRGVYRFEHCPAAAAAAKADGVSERKPRVKKAKKARRGTFRIEVRTLSGLVSKLEGEKLYAERMLVGLAKRRRKLDKEEKLLRKTLAVNAKKIAEAGKVLALATKVGKRIGRLLGN